MVNPTTQPTSAAPARDGASPRPLRGLAPSPARERSAAERSAEAAQGLSIVVPLYNEAASLGRLHGRLVEVAQRLAASRGLTCEIVYVDDGSRDDTLAIARALPAATVDVQVVSLSRNFGKEAALLAGLDHARRGAVLFMDGDGQHPPRLIETLVGPLARRRLRRGVYRQGPSRQRILDAARRRESVLRADQLGRPHQDPRRCRRLSAAVAARRRRRAPAAGAQPLLQGPVELDRLPPDPHRLSAGASARTAAPP